ncbi:MAG: MATE family efflux transporter [Clostridia bacterium]|nr:MATE family efflux transporter [Clostridia bacterium]
MFNKKKKKKEIDLLNGPILPKIISYSLVIMATNLMQLLFNTADMVIVGKFAGNECLGAVGATTALVSLFLSLFTGFAVGVSVITTHTIGAGDIKGFKQTITTAFSLSILLGALLSILGFIFAEFALVLMDTPSDLLPLATLYLRIYFLCMLPQLFFLYMASVLRSLGNTKTPMYMLMVAGVVNVVLNIFFVVVCKMNVDGVALATVISQYVSAGLLLWHMMKTDAVYKLEKIEFKFYKDKLSKIVAIGIPNAVHGVVISISNVFIQSALNTFSSIAVTGSSAAANIETYVYHIQSSFHQAGLTFVGQNYGAGKFDRIKKTQRCCYFLVISLGLTFGILAYAFGEPLLSIYINNGPDYQATVNYGLERMLCICVPYFLCGIIEVQTGLLCGLGKSVSPSIITVFGFCAVRLIWIATVFEKFHSLTVLYACYPVSWLISMVLLYLVYLRAKRQLFPKYYKQIKVREKSPEAA